MANFEAVQGSYGRCLRDKQFIPSFYERLLARDERIQKMFVGTRWPQQNKALRRGISIALTFAGGSAIVEGSMKQMADVHSLKGHAPVDPVLYVHWRESLLEAVEACDPRLTPELKEAWREALTKTTDFFTERYAKG